MVKANALYTPLPWDSLLPLLLSISALATTLLMARLLYLVRPAAAELSGLKPAAGQAWPWSLLLLAVLLVPWWLASATAEPEMKAMLVMDSLWPLLVTMVIAWIVFRLGLFRTVQPVPAGDILALMVRGFRLLSCPGSGLNRLGQGWDNWRTGLMAYMASLVMTAKQRLQSMEDHFARWEVAMLFVVIMALGTGFIASRMVIS
jgi:hypothetical protein